MVQFVAAARCETVCFLSKFQFPYIHYINEHLNQESTVFFVAYGIKRLNGDFFYWSFLGSELQLGGSST